MADRLLYALLSFLFGALIGAVGWWLYGMGFTRHFLWFPQLGGTLKHWMLACGGFFALLGFVFQLSAADALGDAMQGIFHAESTDFVPWWGYLLLLAAAIALVHYAL